MIFFNSTGFYLLMECRTGNVSMPRYEIMGKQIAGAVIITLMSIGQERVVTR